MNNGASYQPSDEAEISSAWGWAIQSKTLSFSNMDILFQVAHPDNFENVVYVHLLLYIVQ
jgi:hypothetical protein